MNGWNARWPETRPSKSVDTWFELVAFQLAVRESPLSGS